MLSRAQLSKPAQKRGRVHDLGDRSSISATDGEPGKQPGIRATATISRRFRVRLAVACTSSLKTRWLPRSTRRWFHPSRNRLGPRHRFQRHPIWDGRCAGGAGEASAELRQRSLAVPLLKVEPPTHPALVRRVEITSSPAAWSANRGIAASGQLRSAFQLQDSSSHELGPPHVRHCGHCAEVCFSR